MFTFGLISKIRHHVFIPFIVSIVIGGYFITSFSLKVHQSKHVNVTVRSALTKLDEHSQSNPINTTDQIRSSLSPTLQWCSSNPFLLNYDKSLILDLERKWVEWNGNHLSNTYNIVTNFIRSFESRGDSIVHMAYPTSLPLPCHSRYGLKRYGNTSDSGKILCGVENMQGLDKCVVYSLGSNNMFDFEQAISDQTLCEIHTYDCTSLPPSESIDRLRFHPVCIGKGAQLQMNIYPSVRTYDQPMNNDTLVYKNFPNVVQENSHTHIHILKMDIEGGEYAAFADLFSGKNNFILPYQISYESHWWNKDIYHAIMHQQIFAQLWKNGYRFLQHEINQYSNNCVEWTLLRVFC